MPSRLPCSIFHDNIDVDELIEVLGELFEQA